MNERRRFWAGALLITGGAAFIALNLWLLAMVHWMPSGPMKGKLALIGIGLTMLIYGVRVLLRRPIKS
jgi:hypothetical protein